MLCLQLLVILDRIIKHPALHFLHQFSAGKKMQKEGRLFRSTKGKGHGFGLVRIDAIVERLEGYLSRNSEDGAFTTEILLPQV